VAQPHDAPSASDLIAAVREFLERDVLESSDGRVRFHTRVAINVLGMVEREMELGPGQAAAHAGRLGDLGFDSDAAFAEAIRAGRLDDRDIEVKAVLLASVRDKLLVANPRYLAPPRPQP
jgi:hypothetical protein